MKVGYVRVKNYERFQHYKDRCPPWIKLHRGVLTDYALSGLPDAAKAHLMLIWLLASECDNRLPADPQWIANRIGATEPIDLDLLLDAGFLELADDRQDSTRADWPSRYVSRQIREAVLERDGQKCVACGATEPLEIDHVMPISKGGTGSPDNLQTLCRPCNRRKRVKGSASAEQVATEVSCLVEERRAEAERETEQIAVSTKPASRATDDPTDGQVLAHERATLWIPDEQPPADWSEARSITVYREQRAKGATGWDLLAAIDGLAELWRRGDPDWLRKRGKACIRAVNRTYNGVRPMWDVALEASRERSPPPKAKHGQPRSIADLLPKAG